MAFCLRSDVQAEREIGRADVNVHSKSSQNKLDLPNSMELDVPQKIKTPEG